MAIDLVTRRFERLEKAQRDAEARLDVRMDRIESKLDAHTMHFERLEVAILAVASRINRVADRVGDLADRVDRLTTAIVRGRTSDLARFEVQERRIAALERKRKPRRR